MSVERMVRNRLAAIETAQRAGSEAELLVRATELVDEVRQLREHLVISVIVRGKWHDVSTDDWLQFTLEVLCTMQLELAEGGRIRALLSSLWVSQSVQANLGYLIRIDGQNYRISPRASYRT